MLNKLSGSKGIDYIMSIREVEQPLSKLDEILTSKPDGEVND